MRKRIGSIDVTYNKERFVNQVLADAEYKFLMYYPVVVDVGANIGTFSFYMYDHADRIYAIEPVEENVTCLRQTINDNRLDKLTVHQLALSDSSRIKHMEQRGDPGEGGWRLSESGDYPVDTRTLKDFMASQNIEYIDLLKIDVEGEESKILGADLFPYQQVGTVLGEYHDGGQQNRVHDLLTWMGYRYFDLGNNHFLARR